MTDTHAATDLEQYIASDADLYRQQHQPILKNLATKKVRSQYKHDLAVKLFGYLVESGAKKYVKALGLTLPWHKMFNVPTRKRVAEELTKSFEGEFELGNYDNFLPKKYQKKFAKQHLVPPHRHHARKAKSMADYEAEGYKAHTWYVADSPYSQPKIRDAWQRGAWKWQQEQRAQRPAKTASSHATRSTRSLARHDHARKKSTAQLDREITNVVPSWRGGR